MSEPSPEVVAAATGAASAVEAQQASEVVTDLALGAAETASEAHEEASQALDMADTLAGVTMATGEIAEAAAEQAETATEQAETAAATAEESRSELDLLREEMRGAFSSLHSKLDEHFSPSSSGDEEVTEVHVGNGNQDTSGTQRKNQEFSPATDTSQTQTGTSGTTSQQRHGRRTRLRN